MPKVSVIIPVYDTAPYLTECLDSVRNQTLTDIEILCVDDGSRDESPRILDRYASVDSRFHVVRQENAGQAAARNRGLRLARGEYVLFVDSDDRVDEKTCKKTVDAAERNEADIVHFTMKRSLNVYRRSPLENALAAGKTDVPFKDFVMHSVAPWDKLWRTSFLNENNMFFPEGIYHEDRVFCFKAFSRNPNISVLPESLYFYRINTASTTQIPSEKLLRDMGACYRIIKDELLESGLYHGVWKDYFLESRIVNFYVANKMVGGRYPALFREMVETDFDGEEWNFALQSDKIPWTVREFYRALRGRTSSRLISGLLMSLHHGKGFLRRKILQGIHRPPRAGDEDGTPS